MALKLTPAEIQHFQAQSGKQLDRAVAMSLIEGYTTRVISRQIRTVKTNRLVTEVLYQLDDSGLEVGHYQDYIHQHGVFTMYHIGEGSKLLIEARASLGI